MPPHWRVNNILVEPIFFIQSPERRMFIQKVSLDAAMFLDSRFFNSVARNVENRLACVANNMAHVSRLVLGRFMSRAERPRLHGNALNLCVVMDTLPHFLLTSTPFWFHLAFPAVFLSFCSLFNTPYTPKSTLVAPWRRKGPMKTRKWSAVYGRFSRGFGKRYGGVDGGHKTIAVRSCKVRRCQMYGSLWKFFF